MELIVVALMGVQAGSESAEPLTPQEIIVTGERSRRSIRETASSVQVFTADEIEAEAGADRLEQILEMTPNVTVGTANLGPTIRGQNTTGVLQDLPAFLGGTRPRVTLQVDGRAVSYSEFVFGVAPLWDVEQVEVFRSAQTTTQGRNSIAGAIFVETEDPTYVAEARGRAIVGDIAMHQVSAVASGPLIDGELAIRIAGDLRHGRPTSEIADRMAGADPDNDDYGLVRVKLLAEPNVLPWLRLEATMVHSESKAPQVEGVRAPFKLRRDPIATYGVFSTEVDSFTLRADARVAPSLRSSATLSLGQSRARRFAPPGLGEAVNRVKDWSAETILTWEPGAPIKIVGGLHLLGTTLDQEINLSAVLGTGRFDDRQHSFGLFGDATARPLPGVSLSAGLRYQRDSQDRVGEVGNPQFVLPLEYRKSFDALLPRFSLAIDISPTLTTGILFQRAYNPGGATINFDTGDPETFDAESAWSFELFARGTVGRLRLGANMFFNHFRDSQRAQSRAYAVPGGATAFWAEIENVPRARSYGAELSGDWRIADSLRINGGLGLLRTKIVRTTDPANPINRKEFQRAPHLTFSGGVDWRPLDRLRLSATGRYHSDYYSTDTNASALRIKDQAVLNARAALEMRQFTLFGYARNLFDTFYMTHLSSINFGSAVDPREIGVGLEARF